ncbi:MAG: hypothetical protein ACKN9T_02780, partial [Candidatus Methylumidiphilus sp.]
INLALQGQPARNHQANGFAALLRRTKSTMLGQRNGGAFKSCFSAAIPLHKVRNTQHSGLIHCIQ